MVKSIIDGKGTCTLFKRLKIMHLRENSTVEEFMNNGLCDDLHEL